MANRRTSILCELKKFFNAPAALHHTLAQPRYMRKKWKRGSEMAEQKKITANKFSEKKRTIPIVCTLNKSAVDKNIATSEMREKSSGATSFY